MCRSQVLAAVAVVVLAVGLGPAAQCAEDGDLLSNGGFEAGLDGWAQLWTREAGVGSAALDNEVQRSGRSAVRISHMGEKDWSFGRAEPIQVRPGDLYELSAWVRVEGAGAATLCAWMRGEGDETIAWTYAARTTYATADWVQLGARFVVPPGARSMVPRLVGWGRATVWLDDVWLTRTGRVETEAGDLPEELTIENAALRVAVTPRTASLAVTDKRTGRTWTQDAGAAAFLVTGAEPSEDAVVLDLLAPETATQLQALVALDGDAPELVVELRGTGEMKAALPFPHPFATQPGDLLIMPVNEGISYPADDESLPEMYYILYGGHGLCMAWYGVTAGRDGMMALVETPDDGAVRVARVGGLLREQPVWEPQMGRFGYPRRIRYAFLEDGGYVAMAKRYRFHASQVGLLKTLAEKRVERPAVDMLVGAVNVWCWDGDAPAVCRELQAAGIERILWSNAQPPDHLRETNEMGVLTSRYDIYQDVMNPANFDRLQWTHGDWPAEAWPQDCVMDEHGRLIGGWEVEAKGGGMIPCNVLCDSRAIRYARPRIAEELKTHPYRCRFIDTTTASSWRECYGPDHPMTRSQSRWWKMELLRLVSGEFGLVCGSETGHEAAVPHADYFEGMLSLGPYRVPDCGRRVEVIWDEVPQEVAKFQTGHRYRLPLWELVYHDCVIAQWYWGDYSNKLPSLWDRRDLWNALYATPPMFMFDRALWERQRERFAQSYRATCPIARACGYSEMLGHRWLTEDHAVQQTWFGNGAVITANFGDQPFTMADGYVLAPLTSRTEGL